MLLMIDNYDSFTYNLVQYLGELGEDIRVFRNDRITIKDVEDMSPERIVISPGPCTPKEAGISIDVIRHFAAGSSARYALAAVIGAAGVILQGQTGLCRDVDDTMTEGLYSACLIRFEPRDTSCL